MFLKNDSYAYRITWAENDIEILNSRQILGMLLSELTNFKSMKV